jgi:hypothetical protein
MKILRMSTHFAWISMILLVIPNMSAGQASETDKQIATALSSGNAAVLAGFFNSMVDLTLPGIEDNFGKTQATRILQDFFSKNPVKSYKATKLGSSNDGSQFSIGRMEAGSKIYRIYYLLKKSGDKYLIHQFQIQNEN